MISSSMSVTLHYNPSKINNSARATRSTRRNSLSTAISTDMRTYEQGKNTSRRNSSKSSMSDQLNSKSHQMPSTSKNKAGSVGSATFTYTTKDDLMGRVFQHSREWDQPYTQKYICSVEPSKFEQPFQNHPNYVATALLTMKSYVLQKTPRDDKEWLQSFNLVADNLRYLRKLHKLIQTRKKELNKKAVSDTVGRTIQISPLEVDDDGSDFSVSAMDNTATTAATSTFTEKIDSDVSPPKYTTADKTTNDTAQEKDEFSTSSNLEVFNRTKDINMSKRRRSSDQLDGEALLPLHTKRSRVANRKYSQ